MSSDDQPTARCRPAPPLRPFIDGYVGYRVDGVPGAVHRGLPSRHLTMIVAIGEPVEVLAQPDPSLAPGAFDFALAGLQLTPALIGVGHRQEGVTIELTPLGARTLLGVRSRELWNTTVEAETVLGRAARELHERLQEPSTWAERFAACDDVLARVLGGGPALPAPLRRAWEVLVASHGTVGVTALADQVGWSRRHLTQRFSDEFGLSPKAAGRVVRFDRARRLLASPQRPSLAEIAALCGYADQPHLTRDFVRLAGCPPAAWLAAEHSFVQDAAAEAVPR